MSDYIHTSDTSNMYDYRSGERRPFDPGAIIDRLAGCILCHRPVVMVGVFRPDTDEGRAAVLRLRVHPLRPRSDPAFAYGLCAKHGRKPNTTRIEAAIFAMADRVVVQ